MHVGGTEMMYLCGLLLLIGNNYLSSVMKEVLKCRVYIQDVDIIRHQGSH